MLWYAWALLGYAAWPTYLIYVVVTYERAATRLDIPEAEGIDAVGQWSPWVVVGLTLLASIVDKARQKRVESLRPRASHDISSSEIDSRPWWMFGAIQVWLYVQLARRDWDDFRKWWEDPVGHSWSEH